MSQVKHTCSVTSGSVTVTVPGVDLTARIKAGAMFLVDTLLVPYFVAVNSTYASGNTVVTLTGAYAGATNTTAAGVFAVDFTYPDSIPTLAQGDVGTAAVFTQAMLVIQGLVSGGSGSGGSGGIATTQPFDLTTFYAGKPPVSAIVTRVPLARAVSFPAGLTGSVARAVAAATAQTDFVVQKNGVTAATVRFAAGATSATFTGAFAISGVAGDVIAIVAPAVQDATLADIGFTLAGTR